MTRNHRITPLVLSAAIGAAALGATSAHACVDPRIQATTHATIELPAPTRDTTTVQSDGTHTGVGEFKVHDLQGNLAGEGSGTSSAVKIAP